MKRKYLTYDSLLAICLAIRAAKTGATEVFITKIGS